ncbi:MAG: GTP-binding protein [Rhodocyclales bacterium GWA2_65_19]|nr:MAG: GTP-binding protein [Rhodocyclales bacterium GWA2_65_19]
MNVDHHDLHHEFPEHAETIHALKLGSKHFARLFDEYHALTAQVEALEDNDSPVADVALEDMKKTRLKLKDELYAMLQASKA